MLLDRMSANHFETAGTIVGLSTSGFTALQIVHELRTAGPSTLSPAYVLGLLLIFLFWITYGVRFRRAALWLTNGVASVLQAALLVIVLLK